MQVGSNKTTYCGARKKPLLYQMLTEIHEEVFSNWENGKPKDHVSSFNDIDQSLIFTNNEKRLKSRLMTSLNMLDQLLENITIVHYCENENDFGSIITKMDTPNFSVRFQIPVFLNSACKYDSDIQCE